RLHRLLPGGRTRRRGARPAHHRAPRRRAVHRRGAGGLHGGVPGRAGGAGARAARGQRRPPGRPGARLGAPGPGAGGRGRRRPGQPGRPAGAAAAGLAHRRGDGRRRRPAPRAGRGAHRAGHPYLAEALLGAAALVLILVADTASAIVFAALGALVYSTIANASALRLGPDENRPPLLIALGGLGGCVVLALSLPLPLVAAGLAVIAAGALVWLLVRALDARGG